jgi:hypothetical protein
MEYAMTNWPSERDALRKEGKTGSHVYTTATYQKLGLQWSISVFPRVYENIFVRYASFSVDAWAKIFSIIGVLYLFIELLDTFGIYQKAKYNNIPIQLRQAAQPAREDGGCDRRRLAWRRP